MGSWGFMKTYTRKGIEFWQVSRDFVRISIRSLCVKRQRALALLSQLAKAVHQRSFSFPRRGAKDSQKIFAHGLRTP